MVEFEEINGSAYKIIAEYVERFCKRHSVSVVVVTLGLFNCPEHRYWTNDKIKRIIAFQNENDDVDYEETWYHGEQFMRLYSIQALSDVPISGGIYDY